MIRKFTENDTDRIMQIWLQANIDAHSFIPADYWDGNFEYVKSFCEEHIPQIKGRNLCL